MKVIVLNVTPYKEKDAIINAISEEGFVTFSTRSVFDPKSKNAFLNCPLLIADVTFSEGNYKYKSLKSASLIINPMRIDGDYYYLSSMMFLSESTKTMVQEEDASKAFSYLEAAVEALKNKRDYWAISLIYLAKLVQLSGYSPNTSGCVKCGSKNNIVAFSFEEGGFLCLDCIDSATIRDLNAQQLLILRKVFMTDNFNDDFVVNKEDAKPILNKFFAFIDNYLGVKLTSSKLLNK